MTTSRPLQPLKYNRARLAIMELIASRKLRVGDRVPSQNELTVLLDYSEITIRHALADMQACGLLTRRKGSGTYLTKALKDDVFQTNILNIYVDQPQENRAGHGMLRLRRFFASRGIGMHDLVVTEYGLEIVNAARDSIGIIVNGWLTDDFLLQLQALGLPFIIVGNFTTALDVPVISCDLQLAAERLTSRLIQKGCRHIALFRGEAHYYCGDCAEAGYRNAIRQQGRSPMIMQPETRFDYAPAIEAFMEQNPEVDGILMEHTTLIDFIAWSWKHNRNLHPKLAFLSSFEDKQYLFDYSQFLWVTFDDIKLLAGRMLLNHLIGNSPLTSLSLPPVIWEAGQPILPH